MWRTQGGAILAIQRLSSDDHWDMCTSVAELGQPSLDAHFLGTAGRVRAHRLVDRQRRVGVGVSHCDQYATGVRILC